MKSRRTTPTSIAALLIALLLAVSVAPAFAVDEELPPVEPTVVAGVVVGGVDVSGLTAAQVEATITANVPALAGSVVAKAYGSYFTLMLADACPLDSDGLTAAAIAATGPVEIAARYDTPTSTVNAFVSGIASAVNTRAVSARRTIVKRRLKLTASRPSRTLDRVAATAIITQALAAKVASAAVDPTADPTTVTVPVAVLAPKVTSKNIGKTIIVSLREFKVLLYNGARVEKTYRCAIGMPGHRTPTGTFKVIGKSSAPTWRNPGSAWAKNMPQIIRPGYYNPLGLRALYINSSGIRIHGTAKSWSMGHMASHGCIRLTNRNVVDIYPRVKVGTPVYILK